MSTTIPIDNTSIYYNNTGTTPVISANINGVYQAVNITGLPFDGASDCGPAINTWLATLSASFFILVFPVGTFCFGTTVKWPSNCEIIGQGTGLTIIKDISTLSLSAAVWQNQHPPAVFNTRIDSNIRVRKLTFQGGARVYPAYPASGYTTIGYMMAFFGVTDPLVEEVEVINHQSIGITFQGCLRERLRKCKASGCGKIDNISSPFQTQNGYGSFRQVASATNANPCVVTFVTAVPASWVSGHNVNLVGFSQWGIADGQYTLGTISNGGLSAQLTTVNSTAFSTFTWLPRSYVTETFGVPSQDSVYDDITVHDCLRSAVSWAPIRGGRLSNLRSYNTGESCVFTQSACDIQMTGIDIDTTSLTDLTSNGIELDYCTGVKVDIWNIRNTAFPCIAVNSCTDVTIDNGSTLNPTTVANQSYGQTPLAIAAGLNGTAVPTSLMSHIYLIFGGGVPCSGVTIGKNVHLREDRGGFWPGSISTSALSQYGLYHSQSGTVHNLIQYLLAEFDASDLNITNKAQQICGFSSSATNPATNTYRIRGWIYVPSSLAGLTQSNEHGAIVQKTISSAAGSSFNFGLPPRSVRFIVTASADTTNVRTSDVTYFRDITLTANGQLGWGSELTIDSVASSPTVLVEQNSTVPWILRNSSGVIEARGEIEANSFQTDQTLFVNVTVATIPVLVTAYATF